MLTLQTEKIEKIIEAHGWSMTHFAKKVGISRQTLYNILDDQNPSLTVINKLADALDVNPKDLLNS